ncbi:MAG TPA: hypothetical protein ENN21_08705 [Spirochaetes bacterium]|nr:hypothetical protein [Spirochaetota bacterium]
MKSRLIMILAACAMVIALASGLRAQTLSTDIVFLKAGYVPLYTYELDTGVNAPVDYSGFAIQGEYNLNFNNFWLGFAVEYSRLYFDSKPDIIHSFLTPRVSAKLAAAGGLYIGAGLSGKYLISVVMPSGGKDEPDKKIDLWADGILGYYLPIAEAVFLDLEGRFGYNLTRQQFADNNDVKYNYDIAVYLGIGYRAAMSDY